MTKCGQIVAKYYPNLAKFGHTDLSGPSNSLSFIQYPSNSIKSNLFICTIWTIRMKSAFLESPSSFVRYNRFLVRSHGTENCGPLCRYGIDVCLTRNIRFYLRGAHCCFRMKSKKSNFLLGKRAVDGAINPVDKVSITALCTALDFHVFVRSQGSIIATYCCV